MCTIRRLKDLKSSRNYRSIHEYKSKFSETKSYTQLKLQMHHVKKSITYFHIYDVTMPYKHLNVGHVTNSHTHTELHKHHVTRS